MLFIKKTMFFLGSLVILASCSIDESNDAIPIGDISNAIEKLYLSTPNLNEFKIWRSQNSANLNSRFVDFTFCGEGQVYPLYSGQDNLEGGSGVVENDAGYYYVSGFLPQSEINLTGPLYDGWKITDSHLAVGVSKEAIGAGRNPKPGKFNFQDPDYSDDEGVTYKIDKVDFGDEIYFALHLELSRWVVDESLDLGGYTETEGAWVYPKNSNEGGRFVTKGNWATYAIAEFKDCPPPPPSVTSSTGKIWMDRNLGASQVATSSIDAASYGDLYQWGRGTDGHQIRTSGRTATLSSTDAPGNANFIFREIFPYDWRSSANDNLWQGVSGINNPCPTGYRLPTKAEWDTERNIWSSNDATGAFASPLKLPMTGRRNYTNGLLVSGDVGVYGHYWSSTVSTDQAFYLRFKSDRTDILNGNRAYGFSVRCLKG